MKRSLVVLLVGTVIAAQAARAPPAVAEARVACETDIPPMCAGVQSGSGRILTCLKQHPEQVSDGCHQAVVKAARGPK